MTTTSAGNVQEYLNRMAVDATEINTRLIEAPASLIGQKESKLWVIIERIKKDIEEASKVWDS